MKNMKKRYACPVELALEFVGGKWKAVILAWVKEGPHRYSDLRRKIPGISEKILTEKLRQLEKLEILHKVPDRADSSVNVYALTERGEGLRPVLDGLFAWGEAVGRDLGISTGISG